MHDRRQNKNTHNVCVYAFIITCIIMIESQAFHVTENSDDSGFILTIVHNVTIELYKNLKYRVNLTDLYNIMTNRTNELFTKVQTPIKPIHIHHQTLVIIGIMIVWILACCYFALDAITNNQDLNHLRNYFTLRIQFEICYKKIVKNRYCK